ncbi:MAG TPA: AMP-binding protein, partial [Casimicrobiaceae bacterium]|nr:AMP-binding protein [Casimicrobiaceae bacterium]
MNITDPIRRNARIAANTLAVVRTDGTPVSYRELDRAIDLCATRALELGLGPGRIVAPLLSDSYRMLVCVLGLARIGAAIAPASLPDDKLDTCLVDPNGASHARLRTVQLSSDWWEDRGGALP